MVFGEVGWGAGHGWRRCCEAASCRDSLLAFITLSFPSGKPSQVNPSLLGALRGSCLGQEMAGTEDSIPGILQLRPPARHHQPSSAAPQPRGKSLFPSSSLGNGHVHSQVHLPGFNSLFPYLSVRLMLIAVVLCKPRGLSPFLSLFLFFICICVEDNHSSEGYSHHKSTMTLFSPSLSLSTVLLYNWQLMLERTWNGGEITAIYQPKL